jgi:hypothetical protein
MDEQQPMSQPQQQPQYQVPQNMPSQPQMPLGGNGGSNKKLLGIILGVVALVAIGIGVWAFMQSQNDEYAQESQTPMPSGQLLTKTPAPANNGSVASQTRLEFPWSSYPADSSTGPYSTNGRLIGQTVTLAPYSKATTVIAGTFNSAAGTSTAKAYVFGTVNLALNGHIDILYIESATQVLPASGATIGQKILMSHNDLVNAAKTAAGIQAAAPTSTPVQGTSTGGLGSGTKTPVPTTAPAGPNAYAGSWNGTFRANSLSAAAGCPNGTVSMSVATSGSLTGSVNVAGGTYYGGGSVNSSGHMSGGWTIGGGRIDFTGTMSGNNGSGSYVDGVGCSGTFSIAR